MKNRGYIIKSIILATALMISNHAYAGPFDDNETVEVKAAFSSSDSSSTDTLESGGKTVAVAAVEDDVSIKKGSDINSLQMYLTDPSAHILLVKQPTPAIGSKEKDIAEIIVDSNEKYQAIDGFGFALTGGSAYLLNKMSVSDRREVLRNFYDSQYGIGASMIRISIGASDLSKKCFTYDEKLMGTDKELKKFNIKAGDKEVIPMLKEILTINPNIKILATPWSAPTWMKTKRLYGGGNLKTEYYQVYADYFVKYLQAMKDNGINVNTISCQNEPECDTNKPSMAMDAVSQANFIGKYLGPTLEKNGFGDIEILCWDHNCDKKEYALTVMGDTDAGKYVTGSAWHLYAGNISTLSEVYAEHPEKKLYLTEQWTGRTGDFGGDFKWHLNNVVLGTMNNYGNAAFEWNLASDQNCDPHTLGGCPDCKGAVTINKHTKKVDSYNQAYYIIGQVSKFVRPGSVRISAKSSDDGLKTSAFETTDGKMVVVVLNNSSDEKKFNITCGKDIITSKLNAGAAATYTWQYAVRSLGQRGFGLGAWGWGNC